MAAPVTSSAAGDATAIAGSTASLSATTPTNTVNDNELLMLCTSDQNAATVTAVFTPPAGWTPHPGTLLAIRGGGAGAGASMQVFYKTAASEGASYSVGRTNGSGNWGVEIIRTSHPSGIPAIDLVNFSATAAAGTNQATVGTVTTQVADTLVLALATWDEGKTYTAPPTGYTLVKRNANGSNDMAVVQQTQATGGTVVTGSDFTLSSATHTASLVIMLSPPAGGGTTPTVSTFMMMGMGM